MSDNQGAELPAEVWAKAVCETDRLCYELDITNADHIVLWLEHQLNGHAGPLAYIACRILDAHEAATTPASAGVLVEAAQEMLRAADVAAMRGYKNVPANRAEQDARQKLRQALSATATPASDGIPAEEVMAMLRQYIDDLRYPPSSDSTERRVAAAERMIAQIFSASKERDQ